MNITSYPKVEHFGSRNVAQVLDGPVVVQEKTDGSQFRFGVIQNVLWTLSRGGPKSIEVLLTDGLFGPTARTVQRLYEAGLLLEGLIYCGEAVAKPKHNILAYDRTPEGNLVLFDVWSTAAEAWLDHRHVARFARDFAVEPVPILHEGPADLEFLKTLVSGPSVFGTQREGIVVKNYANGQFAKLVASEFQEVSGRKIRKPKIVGGEDAFFQKLAAKYGGPARMLKCVQHLRDEGKLDESPKDIGPLIKELHADTAAECSDAIKDELFEYAWSKICKYLGPNMASWYKERLSKVGGASEDYVRLYDGTVVKEEKAAE